MSKICQKILIALLNLLVVCSITLPSTISPVFAADATTSVTITKYDTDGSTILGQETVDYQWMEDNLPVYGDGTTHYFHQGPTFNEGDMWDEDETVNWESRDFGTCLGTDIKDLCELAGGASSGDVIKISSPDGFNKSFDYENVYNPEPEQGKMILTWYTEYGIDTGGDGYVPDYSTGMRLVFFAETKNQEGEYVFGNWDMHETLDESRWHYYYDGTMWPSSSGLAVKWVSDIEIHSSSSSSDTYDLEINIDGDGETVPDAGEYHYTEGTIVNLEAIPDSGWEFIRWEGDVDDNNDDTTTITMDDDKTVTAIFEREEYKLTIKIEGEGQTSPDAGKYNYREDKVVDLEAIPDSGWEFVRWEGEVDDNDNASTTVTMDEDKTITAYFAQTVYELTVNINGQGNTNPAAGRHRYSEDTIVSLEAISDAGWLFTGWVGDVTDKISDDTTVILDEDKQITALFNEETVQGDKTQSLPSKEIDQKSPPPTNKIEKTNWTLALGIIWGIAVLTGVILLVVRVRRHQEIQ